MINGKMLNLSGTALLNYLKSIRSENISKIEVITTPPSNMKRRETADSSILFKEKSESRFQWKYQHWFDAENLLQWNKQWNFELPNRKIKFKLKNKLHRWQNALTKDTQSSENPKLQRIYPKRYVAGFDTKFERFV
jgi:hypothetical protein